MQFPYGVYILLCSDATYYTGYSTNIESRIKAHQNKQVHYTKTRLPIRLIDLFLFENKRKAYDFERYLKTVSGIALRNKRLA